MRFYFQDAGQKIATKCIRVSSTASTQAVIETLIEKFRPDMKMLHMAAYALYEIHPNGGKSALAFTSGSILSPSFNAIRDCVLTVCSLYCRGALPGRGREAAARAAQLAQG